MKPGRRSERPALAGGSRAGVLPQPSPIPEATCKLPASSGCYTRSLIPALSGKGGVRVGDGRVKNREGKSGGRRGERGKSWGEKGK